LVFVECLISIPFAYFRSVQQIKKYSTFNFIKVFFSLLLVIYFVLSGYGIFGAVIGYMIADTLMFLIMGSFVVSDLGLSFPRFKNIREYLAFGMPTIPGSLSSWIVNSSNRYVIGLLMGTTFVGYFSPGYTLGNMIGLFIAPLSLMLPATLSKHYDEHEVEEVKTIMGFSLKYFLALGIPSVFGLSILSRPILNVLSTPEIASQGSLVTPFVALSSLFFGVYVVVVQTMVLEKKTTLTGSIWVVAAILNLILNFMLVPIMGILGAAVTNLIVFSIAFFITAYFADKSLKIHYSIDFAIRSSLASLIMSVLLLHLNPVGSREIILAIIAGALAYFAALFLLKGITVAEIDFFRKLVYK
jgi:O-antigen/teichoic acid export membrane protein